jgi:hypothetical protein
MVSNPDALGVWITELDSNSFLDGLWLPLEFPKQIVSPILASIAVIHLELNRVVQPARDYINLRQAAFR